VFIRDEALSQKGFGVCMALPDRRHLTALLLLPSCLYQSNPYFHLKISGVGPIIDVVVFWAMKQSILACGIVALKKTTA
jgi:hypothetical protein